MMDHAMIASLMLEYEAILEKAFIFDIFFVFSIVGRVVEWLIR